MLLYNEEPDPEAEANYEKFSQSSDAALAVDFMGYENPLLAGIFRPYVFQMQYAGHWVVAVAGTLILCMAIINTVQRRPRNQFAWGYSLNRGIIGFILIIFGAVTSTWIERDSWAAWILPTIAIGYGVAVIVDWFILFFSVRSIKNMESRSRSEVTYSGVGKGDYDTGTGIKLDNSSGYPTGTTNLVDRNPLVYPASPY
ncbi:hypothetical protein FRC01_005477 [Tulasnella sp. 417]|nr:hypothetical protein FRC01_005477 [Tulasnella sp. 417]